MELAGGFFNLPPSRSETPVPNGTSSARGGGIQTKSGGTLDNSSHSTGVGERYLTEEGAGGEGTNRASAIGTAAQVGEGTGQSMSKGSSQKIPYEHQTLDQEVATVLAGFGSFWGKVRKQSINVLQTAEKQIDQYTKEARKDLTPLVTKARANLDSLSETTKAEFARLSEAGSASGVIIGADGMPIIIDDSNVAPSSLSSSSSTKPKRDKGKGVDRSAAGQDQDVSRDSSAGYFGPTEPYLSSPTTKSLSSSTFEGDNQPTPAANAAAFLSNLQAQIATNPNVKGLSKNLTTLQNQVSSNLSHLPSSLQTNLNQLQTQFAHIDLSDSQKVAEGYLHKGESWLSDFTNEVSRLAKDAVKVVPPEEAERGGGRGPLSKREEKLRKAEQVVTTRKEALLVKLRSQPDALLFDPAKPPTVHSRTPGSDGSVPPSSLGDSVIADSGSDTREAFSRFLQSIEDKGGLEGESWTAQISQELQHHIEEGNKGLRATYETLVPSKVTSEAFWTRYFFRVHQIEEDEQRRKQVLSREVTAEEEDDFKWDMEDEDEEEEKTVPTSHGSNISKNSVSTPGQKGPVQAAGLPGSATSSLGVVGDPVLRSSQTSTAPDTPRAGGPPPSHSPGGSSTGDWGLSTDPEEQEEEGEKTLQLGEPLHLRDHRSVPVESDASISASNHTTSPRHSSDGASSYDVVGAASGNPSEGEGSTQGSASRAGFTNIKKESGMKEEKEEEDDEDSDWE